MAFKRKRGRSFVRNASRKRARFVRRKRYMPRRNRRYLRSILRYSETKYTDLNLFHELDHNGGVAGAVVLDYNMLQTSVNINQNNRIGDKVWGKGLKLKMWFSNKGDRSSVMYRVFVICLPHDQLTTTPANLWSGTTSGNLILDILNTDRYKVIYNKVFSINTTSKWTVDLNPLQNREHEVHKYLSFYLPLNRMISYTQDGGNVPKYQKDILGIGYIAYDSTGTLLTDHLGSVRVKSRFYFKDP